jgi:predicted nucleic acid-binding protein
LQIYSRHHFSWYDSLIVAAAQVAGCSILYSEDMPHGQRVDALRIENPFR